MADFAHSISATAVHPLSGSSKSGAPRPVFKPVPPPRPRPQIRPRNEGGADAEMIDLATRVEVLAERDHRAHARLAQVLDRIAEGVGFAPKQPEAALGEHLGLLALDRRVGRMFRRLVRWSKRLTATAPLTSAGLAAKAAASIAITDGGNYDEWTTDLANAVSRDAVRIATAKREPQDDAFLLSLIAQHASALAEWDAADDASNAPRDAYFSVVPPRPRALYWSANDPTRPETRVQVPDARGSWHYVYDEVDVDRLRHRPATRVVEHRSPADWNSDDTVVRREIVPDDAGETRRSQIIVVYDGWEAEKAALRDSTGLTIANDLVEATAEVVNDLEDTILREVPNTLSGLQAKARWIARRPKPATLGIHLLRDLCSMPAAEVAAPVHITPSRDVIETYRTFLDSEFRWLNWETHRSPEAIGGIFLDNPAGRLHGGDGPPPSSRATVVLTLLGLMPDRVSEALAEVEAQNASRAA